ncbi:MAG: AMP-binding protein, partial [Clostridia bacterium]|nr:AMP-binding protein [Clostridia bacterium]
MKLSFSTKGWHDSSFDDFCTLAVDLGFDGVELHNIHTRLFTDKDGAFHDYAAAATLRNLYLKKLSIPCIDAICDVADAAKAAEAEEEILKCIEIAKNLKIPYLRVRAEAHEDKAAATEAVKALVSRVLPVAETAKVTILMETAGLYTSSAELRDLLQSFACDSFSALWNFSAAYFGSFELPETVIQNLGAYVKHVHLNDARKGDQGTEYCLLGEGDLPVKEMMAALRSVNYDGFISLVWNPEWCPELSDIEVIFSQFASYMKQFGDTAKGERALYYNNRRTGRFVWKKEMLIDETFPAVLDRMCEEFPDQYAFKYTTLDYTRTYTEFRADVDECARALVALGVKAGTHVAVWASNVPQWYITFWATVKIGAVLVTVNTAYKIHEIEYLLKQSDTHTLVMTEGNKEIQYGKIVAELCPELAEKKAGDPLHAKRLPFLRNVVTVGYRQKGCLTWQEMLKRAGEVKQETILAMAAAVDKHDVCNMQYMSGTTGFPKGV